MEAHHDVIIIGGGIVGLSVLLHLLNANPNWKIGLVEKEHDIGQHQTSHNSGVIHSGIYYKPGSLKAINCQRGYRLLIDFCDKHGITYELCGKVIVSVNRAEEKTLQTIYERGIANGLKGLKLLSAEEIKLREPYVRATRGILVPQAGIINYLTVAQKIAQLAREKGGQIYCNTRTIDLKPDGKNFIVESNQGFLKTKAVINCAGLYSDLIAKMTMPEIPIKIIPFRGEYYQLRKEKTFLVNNIIYPTPNMNFPFLGVHFTRMMNGGIEAGPSAVLAFAREGYANGTIHIKELFETLRFSGFQRLSKRYWRTGLKELGQSFSKKMFVRAMQELIPAVKSEDVVRAGAGVRAQAVHADGHLIDDFLIYQKTNVINVCNAPSPAATSSMAIGAHISQMALNNFSDS